MEIKLHSSKKHRALGYYLYIIRKIITSENTPFKKLYYADLFCGDGECIIESTGKKYEPPIINSLLNPAKEEGIEIHCFLNDKDMKKMNAMKQKTIEYSNFIEDYGNEDANVYYKKVLQKIPKDQFSIFFLDPTNHAHLKWNTIKEISQHIHTYYKGKKIRRPELIINFMTYTMNGSFMAKSYESINEALGTNEWLKEINKNKKNKISTPVEKALLNTFIKQIESLGYKVPTPIKILNTNPPNTVYYLVWATNDNGYDIIQQRIIPWINKLMEKAQKENKTELKRVEARKRGIPSLNKWAK